MTVTDADLPPDDPAWGHHTLEHRGHPVHHVRGGRGRPVVCLHGWPGFRHDYRRVRPLLEDHADVIAIDLRGFGGSLAPTVPVADHGRAAQARLVLAVLDALELGPAVLVGYDVGSGVAIQVARDAPERVAGLVLGNPMHPGAGRHALDPDQRGEFWYQDFHALALADELLDGDPAAVRTYLGHFYRHWGGRPDALGGAHLDAVVRAYARPGALRASLGWYRSGSSTIPAALAARTAPAAAPVTVPAAVLWGAGDPLFPLRFADGLADTLADHRLTVLDDVGHFVPLEAPEEVAAAVRGFL